MRMGSEGFGDGALPAFLLLLVCLLLVSGLVGKDDEAFADGSSKFFLFFRLAGRGGGRRGEEVPDGDESFFSHLPSLVTFLDVLTLCRANVTPSSSQASCIVGSASFCSFVPWRMAA